MVGTAKGARIQEVELFAEADERAREYPAGIEKRLPFPDQPARDGLLPGITEACYGPRPHSFCRTMGPDSRFDDSEY
jgi:hypothetical protein